jgi:hypothetical protein
MISPARETGAGEVPARKQLSFLNKYLTLWIFLAIFIGVGLGAALPGIANGLNRLSVRTTSIPIAIGLILMMWPPLAKVKYEELKEIPKQPEAKRMFGTSLVLNYVVGPFLMFALAWILQAEQLRGDARCRGHPQKARLRKDNDGDIRCLWSSQNKACLGTKCPFIPGGRREPTEGKA